MRPIPARILSQTITIKVPQSIDIWKKTEYTEIQQNRVHIQPTNEVRKSKENTDEVLSSILFVDARLSEPFIDWAALMAQSEQVDGDIKVVCGMEYTVVSVDFVPNDRGTLHHYEVGLI